MTTPTLENAERNVELYRLRLAGARFVDLAEQFQISPTRARQIFETQSRREKYRNKVARA